jgi:hypothetical protein
MKRSHNRNPKLHGPSPTPRDYSHMELFFDFDSSPNYSFSLHVDMSLFQQQSMVGVVVRHC